MERKLVCAVMVTYHPDATMFENLKGMLSGVQGLVVVDNGSSADELNALRIASRDFGFHLIENGDNLGIAQALNQGVRWAISRDFPWVLLLDQDSRMHDGFVEAMVRTWHSHPQRDKIATVHPRYLRSGFGYIRVAPRAPDGSLLWCLSSGSLMPSWIFERIGWFATDFFIDWVDIEYCFRIRAAGYLLAEASEAILLHALGDPASASFLGMRFCPSHHSAARRYYMSRNRIVVFRKYLPALPLFTLQLMYEALRDTAKCFLGEKNRPRKFRNFLLGTWDGLVGRMGMRESL